MLGAITVVGWACTILAVWLFSECRLEVVVTEGFLKWNSMTSASMILLFGPVPWIWDISVIFSSVAVFLAKGEIKIFPLESDVLAGIGAVLLWCEVVLSEWGSALLVRGAPSSKSFAVRFLKASMSFLFSTSIATSFDYISYYLSYWDILWALRVQDLGQKAVFMNFEIYSCFISLNSSNVIPWRYNITYLFLPLDYSTLKKAITFYYLQQTSMEINSALWVF